VVSVRLDFVSSDTDPLFDDALVLGRRNAEIIELARRHCVHMEFRQSGGQGLLEEMSGLPINMRRVHCRYAEPTTISHRRGSG
jgi:hypothetical protein